MTAVRGAGLGSSSASRDGAADRRRVTGRGSAARAAARRGGAGSSPRRATSARRIIDIVRAAGLSSGAVYGRFDSKDELLMEAVLSRVDENAVGLRFQGKTVGEIVMDTSRTDGALDDVEATQLEAFVAARREPKVAEAIAEARARWRRDDRRAAGPAGHRRGCGEPGRGLRLDHLLPRVAQPGPVGPAGRRSAAPGSGGVDPVPRARHPIDGADVGEDGP